MWATCRVGHNVALCFATGSLRSCSESSEVCCTNLACVTAGVVALAACCVRNIWTRQERAGGSGAGRGEFEADIRPPCNLNSRP